MKNCIAEPNNCIDSILHELVDERNCRDRSVGRSAVEADCHEVLCVDHEVNIETFIRCPGIGRSDLEIHGGHVWPLLRGEDQDARVDGRAPEDVGIGCGQVRRYRESATPSALSARSQEMGLRMLMQ